MVLLPPDHDFKEDIRLDPVQRRPHERRAVTTQIGRLADGITVPEISRPSVLISRRSVLGQISRRFVLALCVHRVFDERVRAVKQNGLRRSLGARREGERAGKECNEAKHSQTYRAHAAPATSLRGTTACSSHPTH
jgi:hypothetical protein